MIELIIDAVKLVFSEEARKSATGLIEFIRRSPDWQKDICTLEAKVNVDAQEHAYLLGGLAADKMSNLGFSPQSVGTFERVYRELTANAFEHGCKAKPNGIVTILIEITGHYVALTVSNPRGSKFDFPSLLAAQKTNLKLNPLTPRGRGLLACSEGADALTALKSGEGIKTVFYNPGVELKVSSIGEVAIIHVLGGFANPSLSRRINSLADQYQGCDLIVDMAKEPSQNYSHTPKSSAPHSPVEKMRTKARREDVMQFETERVRRSIELQGWFAKRGKRVAFLFRETIGLPPGLLPASLWSHTVEGALALIGKVHLRSQFDKVISPFRRGPRS